MSVTLHEAMAGAIAIAAHSKDPSVQNGAVVLDTDGDVAGYGVNRFPYLVDDGREERWERPAKYLWVEHAERNAIYMAAKHGLGTAGGTMVCPWAACADCARAIIQTGIDTLVRLPIPPNDRWSASILAGDTMLREAGVRVLELPMDAFDVGGVRIGQVAR